MHLYQEARQRNNSEIKLLKRELWLSEIGLSEKDVMVDENGVEFVYYQSESDHSDQYEVWYQKQELPAKLQTNYVPF